MKPIKFRSLLWRLINKIYPPLAIRLKATLLGTNRLSIQFQTEHQAVIDYVTLVQPPVWKSINVVNPEFLAKVAAANPKALGIYRAHPNSSWADDPERRAAEHIGRIAAEIRYVGKYFHIVEDNNEYVFPFDSPERIEAADRYMAKFIELCNTVLGKKALVLNASTGNWGHDIGEFVLTLDALWRFGGYIGFHEYDFPTMWRAHEEGLAEGNEGMWHCLRWKRAARTIKQLYDGWCPPFIISEGGIDSGAKPGEIPQRGFRGVHPSNLDASVENYILSLRWYYDRLDDDVFAVTLFGCGMTDPWDGPEGFDIKDTAAPYRISLFPMEDPPEPPEPPTNGGDDVIRVFDLDGNELLGEEALDRIAFHGITIHQPENMRPGEWYWAVVEMREAMHAGFIFTGLLEDGSSAVGQEAAWAWADDMGEADDILGDNYPTDWQKQADLGVLNDAGNMGPAYGQKGWFHAPYEPGPGRAWIRDPLRWAVLLTGMGMLDMTNHHTLFATWKLKQWEGEEPPTPPEPPGDLVAAVNRVGDELAGIRRWLEGETPEPTEPDTAFWAEFYNNITLGGAPVLTRWDEEINFDWGSDSPAPGVNADNFSVRWAAKKTFEVGLYRFKVRADDGVRLWVDGALIIDDWTDHPPTTYGADVTLIAGQHDIRMDYYERGGGAVAELSWARLP